METQPTCALPFRYATAPRPSMEEVDGGRMVDRVAGMGARTDGLGEGLAIEVLAGARLFA